MAETMANPNNNNRRTSNSCQDAPNRSRPRRSLRGPQQRDFYSKERLDGKVIEFIVDEQRGLDQPGSNKVNIPKEQRIGRDKGQEVFEDYLRPAGWKTSPSDDPLKTDVFLAPGTRKKTAVAGVTKFYEYFEIWEEWKKGGDFFKLWGGGDVEVDAPPSIKTNTAVVGSETGENYHTVDYSGLGQPTPGVPPAAASRPAESSTEETPRRQAKRGRQTTGSSKKQSNKRPKMKGSSSNSRLQMESSPTTRVLTNSREDTETPVSGSALNDLLRLQDQSVVTPTTARQQEPRDTSSRKTTGTNLQNMAGDRLRLSDSNDDINKLKKELEVNNLHLVRLKKELKETKNNAHARGFEIEDLKSENNKLREEKAKAKVEVATWKAKCEQMQEEIDQMRTTNNNPHRESQGIDPPEEFSPAR